MLTMPVPPVGGEPPEERPAGEVDDPTQVGTLGADLEEEDGSEELAALFKTLSGPRPRSRPIRGSARRGRREDTDQESEAEVSERQPHTPAASPPGHFTEAAPRSDPASERDILPEEQFFSLVTDDDAVGDSASLSTPESIDSGRNPGLGWSLVDVAGRLAHDIRNPLTSLEVTAFVLGSELKALNRPDLDALVAETFEVRNRVTLGVDEFIEFARAADGVLEISKDWTRLGDVVDDALRDARLYRADGIVYRESPDRSELVALVDGPRLRMVVRSLARYLLDYGQSPVRVEVRPDGESFRLVVEDSDMNMTSEVLGETVERLNAGPSVGAAFGAGLGLFVCRPIVEKHGGTLRAEAGPTGSTSFVILLPRDAGENEARPI